jgi:hypothetical protein
VAGLVHLYVFTYFCFVSVIELKLYDCGHWTRSCHIMSHSLLLDLVSHIVKQAGSTCTRDAVTIFVLDTFVSKVSYLFIAYMWTNVRLAELHQHNLSNGVDYILIHWTKGMSSALFGYLLVRACSCMWQHC